MTRTMVALLLLAGCASRPDVITHEKPKPAIDFSALQCLEDDGQCVDGIETEVIGFQAPISIVENLPGVGPAYVVSFPVNCADSESFANAVVPAVFTGAITTPAVGKIKDPFGGSMISYTCQNASTTLVQVGDRYTVDPDTTRRGPIYCATNCPAQEWGGNAKIEYCRGATDTTIYCRALVANVTEP